MTHRTMRLWCGGQKRQSDAWDICGGYWTPSPADRLPTNRCPRRRTESSPLMPHAERIPIGVRHSVRIGRGYQLRRDAQQRLGRFGRLA